VTRIPSSWHFGRQDGRSPLLQRPRAGTRYPTSRDGAGPCLAATLDPSSLEMIASSKGWLSGVEKRSRKRRLFYSMAARGSKELLVAQWVKILSTRPEPSHRQMRNISRPNQPHHFDMCQLENSQVKPSHAPIPNQGGGFGPPLIAVPRLIRIPAPRTRNGLRMLLGDPIPSMQRLRKERKRKDMALLQAFR
jgi:hypothetical protein